MPKRALFTLKWSPEHHLYALYEQDRSLFSAQGQDWLAWLATHTSFAFHGPETRFNLLKEARKSKGDGYWYAYQRQGKRTIKRYAGRDTELTVEHLETLGRALRGQTSQSPLLEPKFHLPRLHPTLVRRERLLTRLDAAIAHPLTLLSAPAGSGKTTLVGQWIATRKEQPHFPPVAWLALDKNDNDPVRFWRYVITASEAFQAGLGRTILAQFTATPLFPLETDALETTLTTFLNALSHSEPGGVLVLEDYQVISSPLVHRTMSFFLEHLPASIHLMLITRSDPALPLTRLRARGELCELTANNLRFTQEEVLAFFQHLSHSLLSPEIAQEIGSKLDGWAAGLRLFSLSLQRSSTSLTLQQHLENFVSEPRSLQSYFLEEVFLAQPAPVQDFLLHTCILQRLTSSLCATITGENNSAVLLEEIERSGLFLERLDGPGQWYRYHTLFADALRAEARKRLGIERLHAISLQASIWYEQQGMLTEAIETALWAQDMTRAAATIERHLTATGVDDMREVHTLRRWLEQIPLDIISSYPLLCLCYAQVLSLTSAPWQPTPTILTQIKELLDLADTRWRAAGNTSKLGETLAFRAHLAMRAGEQEQAFAHAQQALSWLPLSSKHWRGVCFALLGGEELLRGQLHEAKKLLSEALALWAELGHTHGARSSTLILAEVYFGQGELRLAHECYLRVVEEAREVGDSEDLIPALIGLAQLSYEWDNLETAEQAAQEALHLSEQLPSQELIARATLVLIRVWLAQEQKALAQQRLSFLLAQPHLSPNLIAEVQLCQMQCLLEQNDYTTLQHRLNTLTLSTKPLSIPLQERVALLQAHIFLHQQETHKGTEILKQIQLSAREGGRGRTHLEAQLLDARIQWAEQRVHDACQTLSAVLLLAHTESYLRVFLDQGTAIIPLLRAMQSSIQEQPIASYLRTLLHAFGVEQKPISQFPRSIEPLTQQEQRVLRLLAAELTYPEIARELVVSVNTIKTQVSSIYRKLNIHNRREAQAIVQRSNPFHHDWENHERR